MVAPNCEPALAGDRAGTFGHPGGMHLGFCRPLKRACNPGATSNPPVETGGYDLTPASPAKRTNSRAQRGLAAEHAPYIPGGAGGGVPSAGAVVSGTVWPRWQVLQVTIWPWGFTLAR